MAAHEIISAAEKLRCIERVLSFRYKVYPRRVANGTMTQRTANREIATMEEIAADLRAAAEKEQLL